jgi:hypothetical protein
MPAILMAAGRRRVGIRLETKNYSPAFRRADCARRGFVSYFFTSGQVDCDSGWNASSAGMVATRL